MSAYGDLGYTRLHEVLAHDRVQEELSKVRLSRLYGDAYRAWMRGTKADFDRLHTLLKDLITRKEEITPEEDAAFRRTYRLEAK